MLIHCILSYLLLNTRLFINIIRRAQPYWISSGGIRVKDVKALRPPDQFSVFFNEANIITGELISQPATRGQLKYFVAARSIMATALKSHGDVTSLILQKEKEKITKAWRTKNRPERKSSWRTDTLDAQ